MRKTLPVLAGLAGALIASTTAEAALTGIELVAKQSPFNPRLVICNLYVTFSAPGDNLISIAGLPAPEAQLSYTTNSVPGFHQEVSIGAQDFPLDADLLILFPNYADDTYITIGLKHGYAPGALTMQEVGVLPGTGGATTWNAGGSLLSNPSVGGSYFVLPGAPEGVEVGGQVLIAQLVIDGNQPTTDLAAPRIDVFIPEIAWANAAGVGATQTVNLSATHIIPAPGTLALLGLAGLAGIRRRRR